MTPSGIGRLVSLSARRPWVGRSFLAYCHAIVQIVRSSRKTRKLWACTLSVMVRRFRPSKTVLDPMFAKIFHQIFESSIAEDHVVRHIFMDFLVMADLEGIVDKTHEAIARITNVPIEDVRRAISELEAPDPMSRSNHEDGRRIKRLDDHRDWGWEIVNYEAYRNIRDEEARRAYFREKKREYRAKEKGLSKKGHTTSNYVTLRPTTSNSVLDSPHPSTHTDTDTEALQPKGCSPDGEKRLRSATPEFWESLKSDPAFEGINFEEERRKMAIWRKIAKNKHRQITERFVINWLLKADRNVELPNLNRSCL
jgi:hypothetical protein